MMLIAYNHFSSVRDDRRIVRIKVMDRTASTRIIAQQIQSVTHQSVSARTIRRHLPHSRMSVKCTLLRLPLNGKHRRLCRQWYDERRTWTTDCMTFCLLKHPDCACNITMAVIEFGGTG
ncbi:transposable element Tc1 transposase [Trichonephila clavipes]|nr:transposable element Tc1 transposase [Trichonephila clavipes]